MVEKDQEKISFMANSNICCYKVMQFGLKEAGKTYQRIINKVFANLIGKNIEAYVDSIIIIKKWTNIFSISMRYSASFKSIR